MWIATEHNKIKSIKRWVEKGIKYIKIKERSLPTSTLFFKHLALYLSYVCICFFISPFCLNQSLYLSFSGLQFVCPVQRKRFHMTSFSISLPLSLTTFFIPFLYSPCLSVTQSFHLSLLSVSLCHTLPLSYFL